MYYVCTLVCGGEFGGDTLRALAIAQCCFDRGWESLSKRDVKIDFKIRSQFSTTISDTHEPVESRCVRPDYRAHFLWPIILHLLYGGDRPGTRR